MAYKITNVNNKYGPDIQISSGDVPEAITNLYFTEQRGKDAAKLNRTEQPTFLDKHFYTIGLLEQKTGDLFWHVIFPIKIVQVTANLKTPALGNTVTLYVQKNGGNDPEKLLYDIDINPGVSVANVGGDKILLPGDYIQIDVAAIGSTFAGSDLTVSFKYHNILS